MKHLFTFLAAAFLGSVSFGQIIFQSDLSSWSAGDPTDWMGSKTSFASADVTEQTLFPQFGTSWASLLNTTTSHKRLTTQPQTVVAGETYTITMYVYGTQAEYRTNFYDVTNNAYGDYNPYLDLVGTSGALQTTMQNVTIPYGSGCTSAEFILSVRNTQDLSGIGMGLDSLSVTVAGVTHTPKTIYEIQYTTAPSGDSPELDNYIETAGVVTAIYPGNGYWIQDGNGAWNGIFVADLYNTPSLDDSVTVRGQVMEFFERTQIGNIAYYNVESAPSVIPTPTSVTTPQIQTEEEWEGVLIVTSNAECTDNNAGFGMWTINTNPGTAADSALVGPDLFSYTAVNGNSYDVTGIGDFSYSDRKILPRDANDIVGASAGPLTIYDVQNDNTAGSSNYEGQVVSLPGIVTGIYQIGSAQYSFFIQDGDGAWNGIYVYETGNTTLALGDSVIVTGEVLEFTSGSTTVTELGYVSNITIQNSGNSQPNPVTVTNSNITDEDYEGVLVLLENAICQTATDQYGAWTASDGNGSIKVDDDLMATSFTATVGDGYDITGIRHYAYSENLLLPRSQAEISQVGSAGIGTNDKASVLMVYPNPAENTVIVNAEPNARVTIYSATGAIVAIGFTKTEIPVSGLEAGIYKVVVNNNGEISTETLMIK